MHRAAGGEELGGEPAGAGLRAGAALERVGQSRSGSGAASVRGLPDSRLPASQREHSGWQSTDHGAGHGDFPGPHQPTPAQSYFLCSALPFHARRGPRELKRRHLGDSFHAVKPNVNSGGRLAAERGDHLVREQGGKRKQGGGRKARMRWCHTARGATEQGELGCPVRGMVPAGGWRGRSLDREARGL